MPKYAYIDAASGALIGGGSHREPPHAGCIEVAEDFDISARDKRWNGTDWEAYTPPPLSDEQHDAICARSLDQNKALKALAIWTRQKLNALGLPVTAQQQLDEIKAIYRSL